MALYRFFKGLYVFDFIFLWSCSHCSSPVTNKALAYVNSNGYNAVMQDERGTWRSEGVWNAWLHDGPDSLGGVGCYAD